MKRRGALTNRSGKGGLKMKLSSVKLLYNAEAHFAAFEKYPEGLMKQLQIKGPESYEAMLWAFAEAAKQAELYRRFMGEKPKRILTVEEWRMIIKPGQLSQAGEMVMQAIIEGLGPGPEEDEEIDEVLQELEKKRTDG